MARAIPVDFKMFESPIFNSSNTDFDHTPHSPPTERIIRACDLHPRTMGHFGSTKKLCYAPNIKTAQNKRNSIKKDFDIISQDPIYFRYVRMLSEYHVTIEKRETTPEFSGVVEMMISAIERLNKMFIISPKLKWNGVKTDFNTSSDNIHALNYYNSFSTLMVFNKHVEISSSKRSISYRMRHRFDSKWYFVKIGIAHDMVGELKTLNKSNRLLLNEIRILGRIRHTNIICYFTSWFEQRSFLIQLEFVTGESLYYFLYSSSKSTRDEFKMIPRINRASELTSLEIIKQIGSALSYLHDEIDLAHNAVEPSCIMITHGQYSLLFKGDNPEIIRSMIYQCMLGTRQPRDIGFKLSDFGYAFSLDKEAEPRKSDYMPDVTSGIKTREYWIKRDVYALAMSTIHAMCGANNFSREKALNQEGLDIGIDSLRVLLMSMMDMDNDVTLQSMLAKVIC